MDNKVTLMDNKQGSNGKGPISVYIGKSKTIFSESPSPAWTNCIPVRSDKG